MLDYSLIVLIFLCILTVCNSIDYEHENFNGHMEETHINKIMSLPGVPQDILEHHRDQRKMLFKILNSGKCKHLYIDFGTNIGVQIRKLYEPLKFPGAGTEKHYQYYYGDDRSSVCSVGFEANSLHTDVLKRVEDYYTYLNYSVVIFTDIAVHDHLEPVTFYRDDRSGSDKHGIIIIVIIIIIIIISIIITINHHQA